MGGNSVKMVPENARLDFAGIKEYVDLLHKEVEYEENCWAVLKTILDKMVTLVPLSERVFWVMKFADVFVDDFAKVKQELAIDRKLQAFFGNLAEAEFKEMKRKISKTDHDYHDIAYCVSRCAVLLDMFANNLEYALSTSVLFKAIVLLYITVCLACIQFKADENNVSDIKNRLREISEAIQQFKASAVKQRMELISTHMIFVPWRRSGTEVRDMMRKDMEAVNISDLNIIHNQQHILENVRLYKEKVKHIYSEYFDAIISNALNPAIEYVSTISQLNQS